MKYEPVIGLEIHIQAKTKSKMFCACAADYFGAEPNSHVCPVCLGLPGALPVPNAKGVEQALKLALALNCKINQHTKFDRKNYFYPDLPKGYQISQYDLPIGYEGFLEVDVDGDARRFRITRVHLEEDTGKSVHDAIPGKTALDYNKSGMPLIEVVTEPDFQELKEVTAFAKLLKQTVEYIGVSDAEMQKGQMRFELNISLRKVGSQGLPDYKVEVKNIGSISVLEKVIRFEIARQSALLDAGERIPQQTRGLKDMNGTTVEQRVKETSDDYRYFPEPDIPPIELSDSQLSAIRESMPELPAQRVARLIAAGAEKNQAEVLVAQPEKGAIVDAYIARFSPSKQSVKEVAKVVINHQNVPAQFSESVLKNLHYMAESKDKLNGPVFATLSEKLFEQDFVAEEYVKSQGLEQVQDDSQIQAWIDEAIAENPDIVAKLDKNPNVIMALVGKVMAKSRGTAKPDMVQELLRAKLAQ